MRRVWPAGERLGPWPAGVLQPSSDGHISARAGGGGVMTLSASEHAAMAVQTTRARASRARERRASGGLVYRKVPIVVTIIDVPDEHDPTTGEHLRLATSDSPNEAGRFFRVWREGGRWHCRCAAFQALG